MSFYKDKDGKDIYFLAGYEDDAELKYPQKKINIDDIPF